MDDRWQPVDLTSDPEAHDWTADPAEVLTALTDLLQPPRWHSSSACKGQPELFHLERGQSSQPARAVCADCTVKRECLNAALEVDPASDFGIWAGTTARDRSRLRRTIADEAA